MMIQFRFSNFRSFKDETLLSMEKTNLKESDQLKDNFFKIGDKYELLKTAVIYGTNASGKSNIFKAIGFFRDFVLNSMFMIDKIPVDNFKLNTISEKNPSLFEMTFIINSQIYRYGFKCNSERILEEWLYEKSTAKNAKERKLFTREQQQFKRGSAFREGKSVEDKTRNNTLFLTALSQWNSETAKRILEYIRSLRVILLSNAPFQIKVEEMFDENSNVSEDFLKYLKTADFNIENMQKIERNIDESNLADKFAINFFKTLNPEITNDKLKKVEIQTFHTKFDENHKNVGQVAFDLSKDESMGTVKFISVLGHFAKHLSKENVVIFVDELDSSLHPLLLEFIINLFNSSESNKNNSQLICSVHDLQILDSDLFRRDQIWFTDKNEFEESCLYSLSDFKTDKVRKTQNYAKNYLFGRYGAVPRIKSFVEGEKK